jgi:transcriptional regulator with XRE-family HTH domain
MSESEEFIFNNGYCERVKRFRSETNMTAEQMAVLLKVPADRYRKYETRSPMPVYLIASFCQIVGCDLEHLILGKARDRMKPIIVARKTLLSSTDDELAQKAQQAESTPDVPGKLDQFVEAVASQPNKRRKIGSSRN